MKISVAPANMAKGCNECLQKSTPLFTIQAVTGKLTLCERCMKEAVDGTTKVAIRARRLKITHS